MMSLDEIGFVTVVNANPPKMNIPQICNNFFILISLLDPILTFCDDWTVVFIVSPPTLKILSSFTKNI